MQLGAVYKKYLFRPSPDRNKNINLTAYFLNDMTKQVIGVIHTGQML